MTGSAESEAARPARLSYDEAIYFRDQLRAARLTVLSDAEQFRAVPLAIEAMGRVLAPGVRGLHKLGPKVTLLAKLADSFPDPMSDEGGPSAEIMSFNTLYDFVRNGRNDMAHEGAFARHLTRHAVELALILEDALSADFTCARDFMVSDPVCAAGWQPVGLVRQKMLVNSFSFLPVRLEINGGLRWRLIGDQALAIFLRSAGSGVLDPNGLYGFRKDRMKLRLDEAVAQGLELNDAHVVKPDARIVDILQHVTGEPLLVAVSEDAPQLAGILTAFDLL